MAPSRSPSRKERLAEADAALAGADPVMARLVEGMGPCAIPVRRLPGGHFGALARSILYQQLAGKAAFAIHARFAALFEEGTPTAQAVAALPDPALRSAGLSGSKAAPPRDPARRGVGGPPRPDDPPPPSHGQGGHPPGAAPGLRRG